MKRILAILVLLSLSQVRAQDVRTGEDVLRAMHSRYQSSWYKTLTFTQKSTTYKPDGTSSAEMWYEAALLPGKLRIDIGPPANGNGYLMLDGTAAIFKDKQLVKTIPLVNMLLVLGFDVYTQETATTIKVVKGEGYDLSKVHEDTWDGHTVYVVGANKGDENTRQFWINKDNLLFVRVIEPTRADPKKLDDIRFIKYQPLAGAWIAAGVEVYSEGKKVFTEDYTGIKANVDLTPAEFDPQQFATAHWEK